MDPLCENKMKKLMDNEMGLIRGLIETVANIMSADSLCNSKSAEYQKHVYVLMVVI